MSTLETMNNTLYALDFDGVICNSAIETGMSGWKAALQFWPAMPTEMPEFVLQQFCAVRPILETGYEGILIVRLLYLGETSQSIQANFQQKMRDLIAAEQLEITKLKQIFGATRDQWIAHDLADWTAKNPLYPEIATKVAQLLNSQTSYIVTTKQERFVSCILKANQIAIADERIYGLERGMNKSQVLLELAQRHPDTQIRFLEDRLPTLRELSPEALQLPLKLYLNSWGYNTAEERAAIAGSRIELVTTADFLQW